MQAKQQPQAIGVSGLAGALLGLAITLLLWRYVGINHDGVLYLGQALLRRWPEIYGQDLTFVHGGGQERYTLFPFLLDAVLKWSSPPQVFVWGALAGLLAFAAASWVCVSAMFPRVQRTWAWLGVLCLPSAYGVVTIFSYREQFMTPRPFAEALCLLGVGMMARKRWSVAFILLGLAGLFHPLQAFAVVLIAWPWAVMQDRRWLHALWCLLPIIALALANVTPFGGLLQQLDSQWLAALHEATRQIFVTEWHLEDFRVLSLDVALLALGWRRLSKPFASWCAAGLIGLGLGVSASLLLVDGLHLVLPAGLQLWRVHWFAHFLAMAALAALLFNEVSAREHSRALLLALVTLMIWNAFEWVWIPLAALYLAWPKVLGAAPVRTKILLGCILALGLGGLLANVIALELLPFRIAHNRLDLYAIDRRIMSFPLVALGLPLLGLALWARLTTRGRWLLLTCLLCPLVVVGATRWDSRSMIARAYESNIFQPNLFGAPIPETAQVYWGQHVLLGPWLSLKRASYFSPHQIAGEVFNRGLALEATVRIERMRPLIEEDLYCQARSTPLAERQTCRISDATMRATCAIGPSRGPDFLVLPYLQPQRSLGKWTIPDPREPLPAATFWLYRCTDVMADLTAGSAERKTR